MLSSFVVRCLEKLNRGVANAVLSVAGEFGDPFDERDMNPQGF